MRIIILTISLAATFALTHPANAEPTRRIKALMGEPMSLFDWGMHLLNVELHTVRLTHGPKVEVVPNYNWDKNRIEITIFSFTNASSEEQANRWCRSAISAVRQTLNVDPKTGKPYFGTSSALGGFFSHIGYENSRMPSGIPKELDEITTISGQFYYGGKKTHDVQCQGELRSNKVLFQQ